MKGHPAAAAFHIVSHTPVHNITTRVKLCQLFNNTICPSCASISLARSNTRVNPVQPVLTTTTSATCNGGLDLKLLNSPIKRRHKYQTLPLTDKCYMIPLHPKHNYCLRDTYCTDIAMGTDAGYLDDVDWHFLCMCVAIKISYKNILYSAAD